MAPATVRMSDSPFKKSEAYVECMQTPEDDSSEIFVLVRPDAEEVLPSPRDILHAEPVDIRTAFHTAVNALIRKQDVKEYLAELVRLGDLPGFSDSVDSEDVLALHEVLLLLDRYEPNAEFLLYKFFQETY